MTIDINDNLQLILPEDYQKVELPFFNEWIAALKSGNYKQGTRYLYHPGRNTYCCLGVLARVQSEMGIPTPELNLTEQSAYFYPALDLGNLCYPILSDNGKLPADVSVKLKTPVKWIATTRILAEINDNSLANFEEIAKIIEAVYRPVTPT